MGTEYKWFDVIWGGDLLTSEGKAIDREATHAQADAIFAHLVKMYGETLRMGMLNAGEVGESLVE